LPSWLLRSYSWQPAGLTGNKLLNNSAMRRHKWSIDDAVCLEVNLSAHGANADVNQQV